MNGPVHNLLVECVRGHMLVVSPDHQYRHARPDVPVVQALRLISVRTSTYDAFDDNP